MKPKMGAEPSDGGLNTTIPVQATSEGELLACPWCSGAVMFRQALWPSDGCTDAVIHAAPTDCGLTQFDIGTADQGVSVIAAWNRRASGKQSTSDTNLCEATPPQPQPSREEVLEEAAKVADQVHQDNLHTIAQSLGSDARAMTAFKIATAIRALKHPAGKEGE